jgi:hypothetical protein
VSFIRCINALKGQQAHSVGQRPTKEIHEHHSGQRPNKINNNGSFSSEFSVRIILKLKTKNFRLVWYCCPVGAKVIYNQLS